MSTEAIHALRLVRRRDHAAAAPSSRLSRFARRQGWTIGVAALLVVLLLWRASQLPEFGGFEIRTITAGTMRLAFLAMAQSVIVISGGIDLSVGAMMVLANCLSALWMEDQGLAACLLFAVLVARRSPSPCRR